MRSLPECGQDGAAGLAEVASRVRGEPPTGTGQEQVDHLFLRVTPQPKRCRHIVPEVT